MMQIPNMLECPNLNEVAVESLPILRLPIGIAEAPRLKILILQDCFQLEAINVAFICCLTQVTPESPDPPGFKMLRIELLPCAIPHEINELLASIPYFQRFVLTSLILRAL